MPAGTTFYIEKGMLSNDIYNVDLDKDGIVDHFYLTVRDQFLHSTHPLAWFRKLTVRIDGDEIPAENLYFVLRGQWIGVKQMPTITDIYWQMDETAQIYIEKKNGLAAGAHDVEVTFVAATLEETRGVDLYDRWPTRSAVLTTKAQVRQ